MGRRFSWVLVVLVVGQVAVGAAVGTPVETQSRHQGVAVELTPDREQELLDEQEEFAPSGTAQRGHAFRLYGPDGREYVVYSDRDDVEGRAVVRGTVVETAARSFDVIYADHVVASTRGTAVSFTNLRTNTSAYSRHLVRVRGHYRQRATLEQTATGPHQRVRGVLEATQQSGERLVLPGRLARRFATEDGQNGSSVGDSPDGSDGLSVHRFGGPDWWMSANATLDLAVVPGPSGNATSVRLVAMDLESQSVASPTALSQRSGGGVGDVVTTTGYLSAVAVSASGEVAADGDCRQRERANGYAVCAGPRQNVRVLAGVLTDENSTGETVLPVVGLSNRDDWSIRRPVTGVYTVTGRVVDASQVDPTIPWDRALVVYRLDHRPARDPTGITLRGPRGTVVDALERQLETDTANWSDRDGRQTPAPAGREGSNNSTAPGEGIGTGPVGSYAADWGGIRVVVLGMAALIGGLLATVGRTVSGWRTRETTVSRGLEVAAWVVGVTLLAVAAVIGTATVTTVALISGGVALCLGGIALVGNLVGEGT